MNQLCNVRPVMCDNCSCKSKQHGRVCRLCQLAEKMVNFDVDALDIDMSHQIKCVASVSYDRQKNEFKFSDGCKQEFGTSLAGMMQRQGRTVSRA